jgi:hypothetical protein
MRLWWQRLWIRGGMLGSGGGFQPLLARGWRHERAPFIPFPDGRGGQPQGRDEVTSKVIFLDIDGPMIPATMFLIDRMCSLNRIFPATTVAVINSLCERTGAKVVFNTTHNQPFPDTPDIGDALVSHGLSAGHLHPTDANTLYPNIPRDVAIKEWLARHDEVDDWCAIDDCLCADDEHMVLVDPDAGVHVGHLNAACRILGGPPCLILM